MNRNDKEKQLFIIRQSYLSKYEDIISYANKSGWSRIDLFNNPYLLLHIILEYIEFCEG
jgi:hypothetical protein